jgi:hypothetical protein
LLGNRLLRTSKCARLSECGRFAYVGVMSSDQLARVNNLPYRRICTAKYTVCHVTDFDVRRW